MNTLFNKLSSSCFKQENILLFLVFFIALIMRFLPWEHVFANERIYYYDPDVYMRLRKILVYFNSFPKTAIHDYFQGYPEGTGVITPPTMEYLMAMLLWPLHFMHMSVSFVEKLIALIPPFVGAVTAALIYRFTANVAGISAGFVAGMLLAITPAHMEATILGRFDNEMIEPLFLLITFCAYIKTYDENYKLKYWIITAVVAFLYLSIWRGAIIFLSLVGIDILLRFWIERNDVHLLRLRGNGASVMYAIKAVLIALICITNLWGSRYLLSFNVISWFHVALFAGASVLMFAISRGLMKGVRTGIAYGTGVGLIIALLLGKEIITGLSIITGGNPWLDSIAQYQRYLDVFSVIRDFGLTFFLIPAVFLLLLKPFRNLPERRFIILWGLLMLIAAIARQRYAEYLALNTAFSAGLCFFWIQNRYVVPRFAMGIFTIVVLLLLQLPALPAFNSIKEQKTADVFRGDVEEAMLWLRNNTLEAGDPYHPERKPAYGVLARWDYGGWIETVAQRPSIATNYGTETYGMEEAARFFLAKNETEMFAVLNRNHIKYLVVDNLVTDLDTYARLVGNKVDLFNINQDARTGKISYVPAPELYQLIISRLFYSDGSAADVQNFHFAPVEGLRLVFESSSPALVSGLPWHVAKIKIFEYIPGAELLVNTSPGIKVTLSQKVETNQGRVFKYINTKTADSRGIAQFKLVYSPKNKGASGSIAPAQIYTERNHKDITVTSADIETQKLIAINL